MILKAIFWPAFLQFWCNVIYLRLPIKTDWTDISVTCVLEHVCYEPLSLKNCRFGRYRISSFKRRGIYLVLVLLGAAFIRGRCLFRKPKQKEIKSCVNSKQ